MWSLHLLLDATEHLSGAVCNALRGFIKSQKPGVKREVCDTLGNPACEGRNQGGYRVCPALIRENGPSFEIPEYLVSIAPASPSLRLSNILTHLSVKFELDIGTEEENEEEMMNYANPTYSFPAPSSSPNNTPASYISTAQPPKSPLRSTFIGIPEPFFN